MLIVVSLTFVQDDVIIVVSLTFVQDDVIIVQDDVIIDVCSG